MLLNPIIILKEAWNLYKRRWVTFLGIMIPPVLIAPVSLFLSYLGVFFFASSWESPWFKFIEYSLLYENIIVALLHLTFCFLLIAAGVLIWLFFRHFGEVSLIFVITNEKRIGIIEAYRKALRKIFSYLWVSILAALITIAGFFLFIIPGIVFLIGFSLAGFIVILENLKGTKALRKSYEYVKSNWREVFLCLLFIHILGLLISFALSFFLAVIFLNYFSSIETVSFVGVLFKIFLLFTPFILFGTLSLPVSYFFTLMGIFSALDTCSIILESLFPTLHLFYPFEILFFTHGFWIPLKMSYLLFLYTHLKALRVEK